jgi:hypothetical protein
MTPKPFTAREKREAKRIYEGVFQIYRQFEKGAICPPWRTQKNKLEWLCRARWDLTQKGAKK